MGNILGIPLAERHRFIIDNAAINRVQLWEEDNGSGELAGVVLTLNDTAHLEALS